jgi:hypothetical protein
MKVQTYGIANEMYPVKNTIITVLALFAFVGIMLACGAN